MHAAGRHQGAGGGRGLKWVILRRGGGGIVAGEGAGGPDKKTPRHMVGQALWYTPCWLLCAGSAQKRMDEDSAVLCACMCLAVHGTQTDSAHAALGLAMLDVTACSMVHPQPRAAGTSSSPGRSSMAGSLRLGAVFGRQEPAGEMIIMQALC